MDVAASARLDQKRKINTILLKRALHADLNTERALSEPVARGSCSRFRRALRYDSKTGEWTKKANVKKHPESTETEHRPIGKKPKRK